MRQPVIVASVPLTEMQTSVTAKEKNKEKKGAERDISFHTKINKCSFWIYKHGFGPTWNYLQGTSSSFTLYVASMIRYHSEKAINLLLLLLVSQAIEIQSSTLVALYFKMRATGWTTKSSQ